MTDSLVKVFAIRFLTQIFAKHLQRTFAIWSTITQVTKSSSKRKTLVLKISADSPTEKLEKTLPRSPVSTSNRLYELAKTQQKKREELINQVQPKYSFSPRVNSTNIRKSLQALHVKPSLHEPLAIVSASSASMSIQSTFCRSLTPNY